MSGLTERPLLVTTVIFQFPPEFTPLPRLLTLTFSPTLALGDGLARGPRATKAAAAVRYGYIQEEIKRDGESRIAACIV